jgi:hypothetical protein
VTVADGAADFVVGDTISIAFADAGTYVEANDPANVDCVLAEAVDATNGAAAGTAYATGEFRQGALSTGSGTT